MSFWHPRLLSQLPFSCFIGKAMPLTSILLRYAFQVWGSTGEQIEVQLGLQPLKLRPVEVKQERFSETL